GADDAVELLAGEEAELDGRLAERLPLAVGLLRHLGGLVIADVRIERGHQHERVFQVVLDLLPVRLDADHAVLGERPAGVGPEPSQRMSLAIFMRAVASVRTVPLAMTMASCEARAANLFGADTNGKPVSAAIRAAPRSANCGCVFKPVPTAVPPRASS